MNVLTENALAAVIGAVAGTQSAGAFWGCALEGTKN